MIGRHPVRIAALALALAASPAVAQRCTIPNLDLTATLRVLPGTPTVSLSRRRDADTGGPILRQTLSYANGTTVIVEQENCVIRNLRVTLLAPDEAPRPVDIGRMARALAATPVWKRFFADQDAAAVLARELSSPDWKAKEPATQFSYGLDRRLRASGEHSEAILSFMHTDSYAAQFRSVLSLYIGVGGPD